MNAYRQDWYLRVVAPQSGVWSDGANWFAYEDNGRELCSPYGYAGISGDIAAVRAALGKPLFIRHAVSFPGPGSKSWETRVIPLDKPWLPGSPHLAESRRAARLGIVAENLGSSLRALTDFRDGYYRAMDTKSAGDKYYRIAERLEMWADNPCVHVIAAPGASAIFLSDDEWGHYHLSYRTPQAHNTAMHAIFDVAVPLLTARGCRAVHLGGGISGKLDDPLYKFKSRIGRIPWTVYFQEVP